VWCLVLWFVSVSWLSRYFGIFSNFASMKPQWSSEWHSGALSGCRISWLWVSLDVIARVPAMSSPFGYTDLKSHYLKCRWAFRYWFSLEESETWCPGKFQRYKSWDSWNSRNKWTGRLLLLSPGMKKPSTAEEGSVEHVYQGRKECMRNRSSRACLFVCWMKPVGVKSFDE